MADGPWRVTVTPEAQRDLKQLRRRHKKCYGQARELLVRLETSPYIGEGCNPPFPLGVRRVHFWGDRYRLVWIVISGDRRVDVLGCDLKNPTFYGRMYERLVRLRALADRIRRSRR